MQPIKPSQTNESQNNFARVSSLLQQGYAIDEAVIVSITTIFQLDYCCYDKFMDQLVAKRSDQSGTG